MCTRGGKRKAHIIHERNSQCGICEGFEVEEPFDHLIVERNGLDNILD